METVPCSKSELTPQQAEERIVRLAATIRHTFVAKEGEVFLSLDFRNMEVYIAGVLSQDERILNALLHEPEEKTIILEEKEIKYANPLADLHTITAKECCFPSIFMNVPEYEIVKVAKDDSKIKIKGNARDKGKTTNFGIIYYASAKALSELNFVPEEETARWIDSHKQSFPQFHDWAESQYYLSEARGWAINTSTSRCRWVSEENSKAAGASPGRSGLNFSVQSIGADTGERCLSLFVSVLLKNNDKLRGFIHDEFLFTLAGTYQLDEEKTWNVYQETGKFKPSYTFSDSVIERVNIYRDLMAQAESECLGGWPGLVGEPALGPHWIH